MCRSGGLSIDVHQGDGNCFYIYVRLPGGWVGQRRTVHTHQGPCNTQCSGNCQGFDEQAAALIFLVSAWAEQARPVLTPWNLRKRPLDQIIAEIAGGMRGKKAKAK